MLRLFGEIVEHADEENALQITRLNVRRVADDDDTLAPARLHVKMLKHILHMTFAMFAVPKMLGIGNPGLNVRHFTLL